MPAPFARPRLLYVSDLTYPARGRRYGDEDVRLSAQLRDVYDVALCHPLDAAALLDAFDLCLIRNSGPVIHYQEAYERFRDVARRTGARVHNPLTGRGDMAGKQYLVDLAAEGFPVIPTVDRHADLGRLPAARRYVVKPKAGADSIGLETLGHADLDSLAFDDGTLLVQPHVDFRYEVSFYFVDRVLQYALHAPDPERRWELRPYEPTGADREFAQRFADWNTLDHGIQRVDACRTADGGLLLVELEDLNPYLSLDLVPDDVRDRFVAALHASLRAVLET
ncbi:hypothetical protein E4198_11505 [Streptomyces sp. RKND-216]|uniref:hypothetical protein n=1 Tax=Streptomyces sp. RKND-216 TaxID=2562581 RepID=UPI00109DE0A6|nr:hypothetical protein [Streptomyces sp. RKND-216]THA25269.1 hypothetical protein E4198_11505 [Streptomyces sp. RKND-216]